MADWNEFVKETCNVLKGAISGDVIGIICNYCRVKPVLGYETWADYEFAEVFGDDYELLYEASKLDETQIITHRVRVSRYVDAREDIVLKILAADNYGDVSGYSREQIMTVFDMYLTLLDNMGRDCVIHGGLITVMIKIIFRMAKTYDIASSYYYLDVVGSVVSRHADKIDLSDEFYYNYPWESTLISSLYEMDSSTATIVAFIMQNDIKLCVDADYLSVIGSKHLDNIAKYIILQKHIVWNINLIMELADVDCERYKTTLFPKYLVKHKIIDRRILWQIEQLKNVHQITNDELFRFGERLEYYFDLYESKVPQSNI